MTSSSPATNSDPYLWVGPSSGRWRDGPNWNDETTGSTDKFPTFRNAVQFGVDTEQRQIFANDTVTGTGQSASLGLSGDLTLSGTFKTGAIELSIFYMPPASYNTSTLTVSGAGDSLQARSVSAAGNMVVNEGAAVSVAGLYEIDSGTITPNPASYERFSIQVDGAGSRVTIGNLITHNGSALSVTNGGYLQTRRMTLTNQHNFGLYQVDAQSTIEVGTLGNAAAGTWTIDAGRTLTVENAVQLTAPKFVVEGVIDDVQGLGLGSASTDVTGSGRIKIETGASLTIGQSGCQLSVVFKGANADLDIENGSTAFGATIRQFAAGDTIDVAGSTFDSATWKAGVLSLFDSGTLVGTLKVAGAYGGDTFSVSNDTITLSAGSGTGSGAETTATALNSDPYLWVGPSSGRWRDGANWQDQTTADPGSFPSVHNAVQFGVDNPSQQTQANVTVTGDGGSASLGLYGFLTMAGTFRTGQLDLKLFFQPMQGSYSSAGLTVTGAGNSLTARSAQAYGNLAVTNGAAVTVAGTYDIKSGAPTPNQAHYLLDGLTVDGAGSKMTAGMLTTDNASDVAVTNGGYLQARHMVLDNTFGVGRYAVDEQSAIEVGTAGNAAAGTWTVDAGHILTIGAKVTLEAPDYVVNGLIDDVGSLYLKGSPSNVTDIAGDANGTGRIRLEANASLKIGGGGDDLSIVFGGDNSELNLANGTAGFTSTIRQFAAGDAIQVSGLTFDSATWQRNVLSLFDGGTLVGSLNMFGKYGGDTFAVSNDTITVTASPSVAAPEAPQSLLLFSQAIAAFEQPAAALHELHAAAAQQAAHPMLAAVR